MRHPSARRRDERGSTLVEFALVFPVVLLLLFGIIQYAYLYWSLETAAATAREAARRMSVGTDWTCTKAEAQSRAATASVGQGGPQVVADFPQGKDIGDRVVVTVTLQTLDVGLFPLPDDGVVVETARARIENVPYVALTCD